MRKTALSFTRRLNRQRQPIPENVAVVALASHLDDWIVHRDMAGHSARTNELRRVIVGKLIWFCEQNGFTICGRSEIQRFFAYLNTGHQSKEGRWGNSQQKTPLRPSTKQNYQKHLRCFFSWLIEENHLASSPMERMPTIVVRSDQVQPFTREQVASLLQAARRSRNSLRDVAIITMLFDTGLRASELCGLRMRDVDLDQYRCRVLGKGNKYRDVPFSKASRMALWKYVGKEGRDNDDPLFMSARGIEAGEAMTRSGLQQLMQRLGESAGISATRCSPHTFRHTFAVEFLRNGGNTFSLMLILGHTSLHMTNKYVALAQADIQQQHRQFSPADRLERRK